MSGNWELKEKMLEARSWKLEGKSEIVDKAEQILRWRSE